MALAGEEFGRVAIFSSWFSSQPDFWVVWRVSFSVSDIFLSNTVSNLVMNVDRTKFLFMFCWLVIFLHTSMRPSFTVDLKVALAMSILLAQILCPGHVVRHGTSTRASGRAERGLSQVSKEASIAQRGVLLGLQTGPPGGSASIGKMMMCSAKHPGGR